MSNPLVAERQDSTQGFSGVPLLESVNDTSKAIESGDWASGVLGAAGTALDALGMALDPFGAIFAAGVGWLIEHVGPLSDALDELTGDPDQIKAHAETWKNIAGELGSISADLADQVKNDTAAWTGESADAYRARGADTANLIAAAKSAAEGASSGIATAGEVVAAVRTLVRDIIAELVGHLISWALQVLFTLGIGMAWVVPQVVGAIAKTASKIAGMTTKLVQALGKLAPMLKKLGSTFGDVNKALKNVKPGKTTPPPAKADPPGATPKGVDLPKGGGTTPSGASPTPKPDISPPPPRTDPSGSPNPPGNDMPTPAPGGKDGPNGSTSPSGSTNKPDTPPPPKNGNASPDGTVRGDPDRNAKLVSVGGKPVKPDPAAQVADFKDPLPTDVPAHQRPTVSDPVDIATGEVVLGQTDIDLPGLLSLVLRRTHVSSYRAGRSFGRSWASTLDQRVRLDAGQAVFVADDGMALVYPLPADQRPVLPHSGPRWPLARVGDGTWTITDPSRDRTLGFAPVAGHPGLFLLATVTGGQSQWLTIDREPDGTPRAVRHHGGYEVRIDTESSRVTGLWMATPDGEPDVRIAGYHYDDAGDLAEVVNSSGRPMQFSYDPDGRIVRWVSRSGMWYEYAYDESGRCIRTTGAGDFLSGVFRYDTENMVSTYVDSLGNTSTYHLDASSRVRSHLDPLGRTTRYERDLFGNVVATIDPLGNITRHEYNDSGELTAVTYPDGARTVYEYATHRLIATVHPDGSASRNEYGADGTVTATVDESGARTTYTYDAVGGLTSVTDPLGGATTVETNAAGLPIKVTSPAGAVTRYTYDLFGRTSTVVDPLGGNTRFTWTVEGMPLSLTSPDGATHRWRYTADGVVQEKIDAVGQATHVEYGHFDFPTGELSPDGTRLRYTYDTELRLIAVTNQHGLVWRYEHDAAGQLVRETDFDGRTQHYTYDSAGRLVERVNAEGQAISIAWDARGQMTQRVSGGVTTTFAYDAVGRLLRARNRDADVVFEYDPTGRVVGESVNGHRVTSRYDALGRRTYRRTPTGAESFWAYNAADLPVELRTAGETMRFTYDPAGREVERRIGTGALLSQQWNPAGRLGAQTLAAGPNTLQRRTFAYHPDNSPAEVRDLLSGTKRFDIDAAGQVTTVHWQATGVSERYHYDPAGNVTSAVPGIHNDLAGPRAYAGTLLRQAGSLRYEHDREGRVLLRERRAPNKVDTWRYQWDAESRLTAVSTPDGQLWRYTYDPLGRRIGKHRVAPDGRAIAETVQFTWDGDVLVEQVRDEAAATVWNWEPGSHRVVSQTERTRLPGASSEWVDQQFFAIVTDQIGTPAELVTPGGQLAWHARTTLWGLSADTRSAAATPLRFPGQYHDPETGLHFNLHRYYDPAIGQYLSHDPLGLAPGPNSRYYVVNPLLWADPLGLDPITHGRPDGQTVLSGHGNLNGNGTVNVPDGTTLHFYSRPQQRITDRLGNAIEMGFAKPFSSHKPGDAVPDYTLTKPTGLKIYGKPITVTDATKLSDLLKPGMGDVHWAACRT
ncbi:RHS repeat-associated protein [Kibdelosporangium banguiense]|uniref:RHS repeat-associated protein n=1 Tax=Kibdelosporangium banguiense TaxID=1365924 RepID=A0ABS4TJV9_9PSEU|nr:DUF6531 domain-containing protein [Kibdelosporangium banguiense]MBP2324708.1 RHS repeat-associated protein [Kibdelosporangium banguiense]